MNPTPRSAQEKPVARKRQYSLRSILTQSLLATAAIAGIVGVISYSHSGDIHWGAQADGDQVSDAQEQERIRSFASIGTLTLAHVPDADVPAAVESMGLASAAKQALVSDMDADYRSVPTAGSSEVLANHSASSSVQSKAIAAQEVAASPRGVPDTTKNLTPSPATTARKPSVQLAWITLWDTDAEDGDAVRIESQGYSRTILLKKQPVTFAIPVPVDGRVSFIGIRDGEGGGVTVGLASGTAKAILPIMSVGQVLSLQVKVN